MSYQKRVEQNLDHMGTPASQWQACTILGFADTEDDKGQSVKMPEFEFPQGYKPAPTMFKSGTTADDMCCELCSHPIKNAYWLQNDTKQWTLMVGSECVTHFAQASGKQLAKEAQWELNRDFVRTVVELKKTLADKFCQVKINRGGYSYYKWIDYGAKDDHWKLKNLLGKIRPDEIKPKHGGKVKKATSNGAITRWCNEKAEYAQKIIDRWDFLI